MSVPPHALPKPIVSTVVLSKRDTDDLRRLLDLLVRDNVNSSINEEPTDHRHVVEALLRLRDSRRDYFPPSMFGEPAWDLLLAVHASADGPRCSTVASLAQQLRVPVSSTARWAGYLETHGLVERRSNPKDRRSSLLELTEAGRASLELYIATHVSVWNPSKAA
jgi:DNA-binding MarR family transcriptional regulator